VRGSDLAVRGVFENLTAWPTAVFSAALLFVLTWWLAGFFIGGLHGHAGHGDTGHAGHGDTGHAGHGDAGHIGHGDTGHGGHAGHGDAGHGGHAGHGHAGHGDGSNHSGHSSEGPAGALRNARLGIAELPLSMSWLVTAFGAWSASLLLTAIARSLGSRDWAALFRVSSILAVAAISCAAGLVLVAGFAKVAGPIFEDQSHPGKSSAVGSVCRIRIPPSAGRFGDAYVMTGASARSIVRIEPSSNTESLQKNDVVLIIGFNAESDSFIVSEVENELVPGGIS
jgi:hypothetical protein